jgi:hypothetical protein
MNHSVQVTLTTAYQDLFNLANAVRAAAGRGPLMENCVKYKLVSDEANVGNAIAITHDKVSGVPIEVMTNGDRTSTESGNHKPTKSLIGVYAKSAANGALLNIDVEYA